MAARKGRCANFGNCSFADARKVIEVAAGQDFACPECKGQLSQVAEERVFPTEAVVIGAVLLLLIGVVAWWWHGHGTKDNSQVTGGGAVILRVHGSNTIGAQLMPSLAQEFLKQQGATGVKTVPSGEDAFLVEGTLPGDTSRKTIEIEAHGSGTAFTDLKTDNCDLGMASRKIKPDEAQTLSNFGDMASPASEHVLGLDGVAVIVNRSNSVSLLTKDEIAKIFSGQITNWDQVHGSGGQINIYARDDKSGTFDIFKTLVLGRSPLVSTAKRFEDSRALSDAVASDPNGIGFVGFPFVRDAKAIAVSEKGARPLLPTRLTIATEDYALGRRLFLYTPPNPQNPMIRKFVSFALSKQGQDLVGSSGFVGQNVRTASAQETRITGAPDDYKRLTAGAERLSLDFLFRTGSAAPDNKALVDLDRTDSFLADLRYTGQNVELFGFADSTGTKPVNDALSRNRAQAVAQQFEQRGVTPAMITGFGSELPVASNDTEEGRAKNRRVEIWVKK